MCPDGTGWVGSGVYEEEVLGTGMLEPRQLPVSHSPTLPLDRRYMKDRWSVREKGGRRTYVGSYSLIQPSGNSLISSSILLRSLAGIPPSLMILSASSSDPPGTCRWSWVEVEVVGMSSDW